MRSVALDGFDQVGNEVVTALQLRIDVLPRVVNAIAQGDQIVVDAGDTHGECGDDDDGDDEREVHACSVSAAAFSRRARGTGQYTHARGSMCMTRDSQTKVRTCRAQRPPDRGLTWSPVADNSSRATCRLNISYQAVG